MNAKHAKQILEALANWYKEGQSGPVRDAQLFEDEYGIYRHILAALNGHEDCPEYKFQK